MRHVARVMYQYKSDASGGVVILASYASGSVEQMLQARRFRRLVVGVDSVYNSLNFTSSSHIDHRVQLPLPALAGALLLWVSLAAAAGPDPAIITGKYFPPIKGFSAYVAWPSLWSPCSSASFIAPASPKNQGLCGHPVHGG